MTEQAIAVRSELTIEELVAQVQKIQAAMQKVMTDGEHYGVIPGTKKPTLLKPGAEKLCLLFRLDPQYEVTNRQEGDHLTVESRCVLWHIPTGNRMGSGMGSCSTKESKYAFREAHRRCPECQRETIIKGKEEYGGGWLCLHPDTPVLYADYQWRAIGDAQPGDQILGFDENPGGHDIPRKFRPTTIEHVWASRQRTRRIVTEDGEILTTGQHRWLRHRPSNGPHWMPTDRLEVGRALRSIGLYTAPAITDEYRMGYLAGMTLGDGTMRYTPGQTSTVPSVAYWRVALTSRDEIALGRIVAYLAALGIDAYTRPFDGGPYSRAHQTAPLLKVEIRALGRLSVLHGLLQPRDTLGYKRGFVAGFFDAEGTGSDHLRVYQNDVAVLETFKRHAADVGFRFDVAVRDGGCSNARLRGDTLDRIRFFNQVQPALLRKAGVHGVTMHHNESRILAIEDGPMRDVVDIQTSTGTFFAGGLATHNCFQKKGGCGAKFKDGDGAIEEQATGEVANVRLPDQYNTVLKMANKRSLVAVVLNVTAASDIFTQDLEETAEPMKLMVPGIAQAPQTPPVTSPVTAPPAAPEQSVNDLRTVLLGRITGVADKMKMKAKERADLWLKHCGHSGPDTADPAALNDLYAELVKLAGPK